MDEEFISRTPNGLFAEAVVRDVACIFHIEGKGDSKDITQLPDYIYYDAIISNFFDGDYEIKVEGSKTKLKSIVDSLESVSNDDSSHIVFMDRDHDEIIDGGLICKDFVFYTLGYSYENDLWTTKLLKRILVSLFANENAVSVFIRKWKVLEKRISFIHKLNLLSKVNGKQVFKFKGLCGVTFKYEGNTFVIEPNCIFRMKQIWNGFDIRTTTNTIQTNLLLKDKFYAHPGYLIQGHAYENYLLEAIHQIYISRLDSVQSTKSFSLYKHIAFSHFVESPSQYLSDSTKKHYETILFNINKK